MRQVVILTLGGARARVRRLVRMRYRAEGPAHARVPVLELRRRAAGRRRRGRAGDRLLVTPRSTQRSKRVEAGEARLVVAAATDGEVRAVVRRMVRALAPAPSRRPADLPANRTVHDLPPLAILPLRTSRPSLCDALGLPIRPADVAAAVLGGGYRRWDLLRTEGGSVTLGSVLLGGLDGDTPGPAAGADRGR